MKIQLLFIFFLLFQLGHSNTVTFKKNSIDYYFEELNKVDNPKGLLVLFNGGNGDPQLIDNETTINEYADSLDLQCIAIWQGEWFIGNSSYNLVKTIVSHANDKYKIPDNKLYLGGFSLGGFTTLRITELAVENRDTKLIPQAIFCIDSPINYLDLYQYCERELKRKCNIEGVSSVGQQEAQWIKNLLEKSLGNPLINNSLYIKESCYSSGGGNAFFLKKIPVIIFHEIDIQWQIENKCRDLRDQNIFMISQLISYLQFNGNKNAKIITTQKKGYRSNGKRHPHSWSIADPKILFEFLLQF